MFNKNQDNLKAVLFCRVSSKDQEETGYSLPAQEKYLTEYSIKRGFGIDKVFSISESASGSKQRQKFIEMMDFVKKANIKIIICEKVDRFTRNFRDMVLIDAWLDDDEERQIHLVKDSLILHQKSKSQEKLNWGIRILFAKNYIDNLSEEVKKGYAEKLAQGWLPRKPLMGYVSEGAKGHKTHAPDKQMAPLVRRMFELYSSGNYSVNELTKKMSEQGLRGYSGGTLYKSRIHQLLQNPFYYGKILWQGKVYEGKHKPIISKDLFDKVQTKLKRQIQNPQFKKHLPIFKAKIKCAECNGTITWEKQKGNWYGHCNKYKPCTQKKYIRQEKVEAQILPMLSDLNLGEDRLTDWLKTALKASHKDKIDYTEAKQALLNKRYKKYEKRLESIYEDKIDGVITKKFYQEKFEEYTQAKNQVLVELKDINTNSNKYYEASISILDLMNKAEEIYYSPKATTEDRRLLLSYIFSNLSLNHDKIKVKHTLASDFLINWIPTVNRTFELPKTCINKAQNTSLGGACPSVCPQQDSNLRPYA